MNSILAVVYSIVLGYMPMNKVACGDTTGYNWSDSTKVEFMLGVKLFDTVTIYGGEHTEQCMDTSLFNWMPFLQEYYVGIMAEHSFSDALHIALDIRRSCSHPIEAWGSAAGYYNSAKFEISLRVSGKFNIF